MTPTGQPRGRGTIPAQLQTQTYSTANQPLAEHRRGGQVIRALALRALRSRDGRDIDLLTQGIHRAIKRGASKGDPAFVGFLTWLRDTIDGRPRAVGEESAASPISVTFVTAPPAPASPDPRRVVDVTPPVPAPRHTGGDGGLTAAAPFTPLDVDLDDGRTQSIDDSLIAALEQRGP